MILLQTLLSSLWASTAVHSCPGTWVQATVQISSALFTRVFSSPGLTVLFPWCTGFHDHLPWTVTLWTLDVNLLDPWTSLILFSMFSTHTYPLYICIYTVFLLQVSLYMTLLATFGICLFRAILLYYSILIFGLITIFFRTTFGIKPHKFSWFFIQNFDTTVVWQFYTSLCKYILMAYNNVLFCCGRM